MCATTKGGIALKKNNNAAAAAKAGSALGVMIKSADVQERFAKMLGQKAPAFLSSLLTMSAQNKQLAACTPQSVLSAAAIAASLDLPVNPSLGCAWIIPYNGTASFQMAAKGYIQLAQRSNKMKKINVQTVYEGELVKSDRFTETFEFDETKRVSDVAIGYYAYFELVNGFTKAEYWTKDAVIKHAKRFSKTFGRGPWQTDFDRMAEKTVLKAILSRYAPLSTEMQQGFEAEQDDFKPANTPVDEDADTIDVDLEPVEVVETEAGVVDTETGELFPKE